MAGERKRETPAQELARLRRENLQLADENLKLRVQLEALQKRLQVAQLINLYCARRNG